MVVALMICGAIIVFALNMLKTGSIELLSQTVDQGRLQLIAQSAGAEAVAILKNGANRSGSPFWKLFREVFAESASVVGGGYWEKPFSFLEGDLQATANITQSVLRKEIGFKADGKIVITGAGQAGLAAFRGYVEVVSTAFNRGNPEKCVKIKERREVRLANLQDFLDKYALFVKRYYPWYNNPERRIIIEGIPSRKTYSWVYLGSSFYPPCPEFPAVKYVKANEVPPPIFLDIDFTEDAALVESIKTPKTTFAPLALGPAGAKSDGQLFCVNEPIPFKTLFDKGFFSKEDLYSVKQLQEYYKTKIVDIAINSPSASDENTVAYEIAKDYKSCGGDLSKAKMFQAVVQTCIDNWQYVFGYTDYSHIFTGPGQLSDFVKTYPFSGVLEFFSEYAENKYNLGRVRGGKMPMLFGRDRKTPVMVEGSVFLRFFKVAFFDMYSAEINLHSGTIPVKMDSFACPFSRPDKPKNFLSREGKTFAKFENQLMSRAVESLSVNKLFFGHDKKDRRHPEQRGEASIAGDEIFPGVDASLVSHTYPSGKEFLKDRIFVLPDGRKVLDIDGQMVVNAEGVDLRGISLFRGRGHVIVLQGHCWLGSLQRVDPKSNDSLKIYLQNGSFSISGNQPKEIIDASLVALSLEPSDENGLFVANKKSVEINGNLVVDAISATENTGLGKELVIKHDPRLFQPLDPIRVSIGEIKTLYSVFGGDS